MEFRSPKNPRRRGRCVVELERFTGTCYRAANWIEVGTTKGRGKLEKSHRQVLPLKSVLVYPLQKNFRAILAP